MTLTKETLALCVEGELPHIETNCTPEDVALFHQAITLLVPEADGTIPQSHVEEFYRFALKEHGSFERINPSDGKPLKVAKNLWSKQFAMEYRHVLNA